MHSEFSVPTERDQSGPLDHSQPGRAFMKVSQARLAPSIPLISPVLAVDYLYVCAALQPDTASPAGT